MKKTIIALLAIIMVLGGVFQVFADGMVIYKPDPYSDRWDYTDETDQQAFINYQKGLERMVVGIKFDNAGDKNAVWLFPVPAQPSKVVMDVIDELPQMNGQEVSDKAKANLTDAKDFLFNSQLYPALFGFNERRYYSKGMMLDSSLSLGSPVGAANESVEQDVVVYEHLEKSGITSEIITAKTANGLYDYFKNKGLKIEKGTILALDSYIGQDYSFIASWMTSQEQSVIDYQADNYNQTLNDSQNNQAATLRDDWINGRPEPVATPVYPMIPSRYASAPLPQDGVRAVSVIFPTKEIYFPLLPTSVYESKVVPATIKVVGYVTPKIYKSIENFVKVSYYTDAYYSSSYGAKDNFFNNTDFENYTKIEINAPSKYLTEDLWMSNLPPLKPVISSLAADSASLFSIPVVSLVLLLICSLLASWAAGFFLMKGVGIKKILLVGLANCVSLAGLIVATLFINLDSQKKNADNVLTKLKEKGYIWKRRTAAALILLAILFFALPFMRLNSEFPGNIYISLALAVVALELRRIKESDEAMFSELKKAGYSTWIFRPRNHNKLLFIALFSVFFLIISWFITWTLKLIV